MPTLAPLATPAMLGNYLQQTISGTDPVAVQLLAQSSAVIRRYLDMTVTQVSAGVELRTPRNGEVFLKEAPATAVSLLEVRDPWTGAWSTVPTTAYNVDLEEGIIARGFINTTGVRWPTDDKSWRVTYDHGFATVPDDIAGVCVGVAARFYSTPAGIDMERTGLRQVKYSLTTDAFNDLEKIVLDGFKWARVA